MSQKDKAITLVSKMFTVLANANNFKGLKKSNEPMFYDIERIAKEIAIITVDEMIQSHIYWSTEQDEYLEELTELKKEIKNL